MIWINIEGKLYLIMKSSPGSLFDSRPGNELTIIVAQPKTTQCTWDYKQATYVHKQLTLERRQQKKKGREAFCFRLLVPGWAS